MKKTYIQPTLNEEAIIAAEMIALSTVDGEATSTDTPLTNERDDWGDLW